MADVPPEVNYGTVIGRFVAFIADTTDPEAIPDEVPLSGKVTLTPLTRLIRFPTTNPPRTAIAQVLTCPVIDGDLYPPDGGDVGVGALGVVVIATDQPAGVPSLVQWQASFALTGTSVQPGTVVFNVPTNGTVDLSVAVPVPPEPPAIIVVDPNSALEAAAAADAAQAAADDAAQAAADAAAAAAAAAADALNTVKVTTQTFTAGQQTQARANIVAAGSDQIVSLSSDHGVTGDGTTDDSAQFQAWLNTAATFGLAARLEAGAVVRLVSAVNVPTGTRLDLNGGQLRNASASSTGRMLICTSVSDVTISNGILDGDKASFAGVTEQRHNLHIINSQRITVTNLTTKNAKGDGIYIGDDVTGASSDITISNVLVTGNHRNGESISAGKRIHHYGCRFTANGGTSPQSGVDIEPNSDAANWESIDFTSCIFDANVWDGVLVQAKSAAPTARQAGAHFTDCHSIGNGTGASGFSDVGNGLVIRWARNVTWLGGSIRDNYLRGVYFRDTLSNLRFDTDVTGNGNEGYAQPAGTINDLAIRGYIGSNGSKGTFDGINLAGSGTRVLIDAVSTGNTRYGYRDTSGWSNVTLGAGCHFPGNTSGTHSIGNAVDSRIALAQEVGWRYGNTSVSAVTLATRATGDTVDRFAFRIDGRMQWGPGGAGAVDATLERLAVGVIGLGAAHVLRLGRNATGSRPDPVIAGAGGTWYDTTLKKPIYSDGAVWRDSAGTAV